MQTQNYTMRVLTPDDGHALYNAKDGTLADGKVYLAANADAADWQEITLAQADQIRAEQEAAQTPADDLRQGQAD